MRGRCRVSRHRGWYRGLLTLLLLLIVQFVFGHAFVYTAIRISGVVNKSNKMSSVTTLVTPIHGSALTTTLVAESVGASLLDLPAELRAEIYQHLFGSSKISCQTPHATWPACGFKVCTCFFPDQITKVSRQLRYETLPMLLAATTLQVAGSFDQVLTMPLSHLDSVTSAVVLDAKLFSLRPFQLEYMPNLRLLELRNITVWCKFYDEIFLESPTADEVMYSMALFNLQRTGRSLRDLCEGLRPFAIHLCCQFVVNSLSDETIVSTQEAWCMKSSLTCTSMLSSMWMRRGFSINREARQ